MFHVAEKGNSMLQKRYSNLQKKDIQTCVKMTCHLAEMI